MLKQYSSACKQAPFFNDSLWLNYFQLSENKSIRKDDFGNKTSSALLIILLTMYGCCEVGLQVDSKKIHYGLQVLSEVPVSVV